MKRILGPQKVATPNKPPFTHSMSWNTVKLYPNKSLVRQLRLFEINCDCMITLVITPLPKTTLTKLLKTCFCACDSFFTENYGPIFRELWATSGEFKNRILGVLKSIMCLSLETTSLYIMGHGAIVAIGSITVRVLQ